jgi:antitoxin component of MazEF toxin-antitoxin module
VPVGFAASLVLGGNSIRLTSPKEVVKALNLKKEMKVGLSLIDSIKLRKLG